MMITPTHRRTKPRTDTNMNWALQLESKLMGLVEEFTNVEQSKDSEAAEATAAERALREELRQQKALSL
jgi:hypothetical protein